MNPIELAHHIVTDSYRQAHSLEPLHYPDEAPAIRRTLRALMETYGIHTVTMLFSEATGEVLAQDRVVDHERSDAK